MEQTNYNRVEVIECNEGRVYTKYGCSNVEVSIQDNGKTLKIFVNYPR